MAAPRRAPVVAGRFYPADPDELAKDVDSHLGAGSERQDAIACLVPHAGYVFSGHVAGAVYSSINLPPRIIILGPNHTGRGAALSTTLRGAWATPLGEAAIDEPLAAELGTEMPELVDDLLAHEVEHSIEVQLPFLQRAAREFRFVPICVGTSNFEVLVQLGDAIANILKREGVCEPKQRRRNTDPSSVHSSRQTLIVCSSDMNHYEADDVTRIKDSHAIAPMLALDAQQLYEAVLRERISMCGFAPAIATLHACAALGAKQGKLVKYATSADINHDRSYCVGYAGLVFA